MRSEDELQYGFTVVLEGVSKLSEDLVNRLFEAGCDDALPSSHDGRVFLAFTRSAPSLSEAIRSAIRDIKKANVTPAEAGFEIDWQNI